MATTREIALREMASKEGDNVILPTHYSRHKIEPVHFIGENRLDFLVGNVIKYVLRFDAKNGLEDINKARRYLDMLYERESGNPNWAGPPKGMK